LIYVKSIADGFISSLPNNSWATTGYMALLDLRLYSGFNIPVSFLFARAGHGWIGREDTAGASGSGVARIAFEPIDRAFFTMREI